MVTPKHYPKAPITEAIIDLRVRPRADLKLEQLKSLRNGEELAYPKLEGIYEAVGTLEVQVGVSASASAQQNQTGFKFASEDGKYVWQTRINGFTFSRLAPYEDWEQFRDEARRLWALYRQRVAPIETCRLAVRYINRVDLPSGPVDLKDYFRTSPEVSPDLPQELAGFFMQVRIPQMDLGAQVLINQTIIPPAREGVVSVVLDIDVFRDENVAKDEAAIWEFFEQLHDRKNEVFEACITDRSRELFQ